MDIVQQTEQDLRARQIALEEESLTLGIDRYQKKRRRQEEADSGPGRHLIRDTIAPLSRAIDTFVAEARNGKPGKKHTAVRWAEKFPSSELAYLSARHCLNAVSSGESRVQTVAEAIATSVEDSVNYSRFREVSPGLYKLLQTVLKKSTSQRHSRNVMGAAMRRTELDQFAFPDHDGIHFGMKMVELFIEATGFAHLYNDSSHGKTRERVLIRGTEQVLEWLDKAHDAAAHFAPVRLPMLVPPAPWHASKAGGYLTDAGGLVPIVRKGVAWSPVEPTRFHEEDLLKREASYGRSGFTRITRDCGSLRHDDRLDALALAVKFWTDYLDRDVTREEDRRAEELFEIEPRKFEESVFGYSRPRENYYDNY